MKPIPFCSVTGENDRFFLAQLAAFLWLRRNPLQPVNGRTWRIIVVLPLNPRSVKGSKPTLPLNDSQVNLGLRFSFQRVAQTVGIFFGSTVYRIISQMCVAHRGLDLAVTE